MNILKTKRIEKRMTQSMTAKELGWSDRKYNMWETNPSRLQSIKFDDVVKLTEVLDMTVNDVMNYFSVAIQMKG